MNRLICMLLGHKLVWHVHMGQFGKCGRCGNILPSGAVPEFGIVIGSRSWGAVIWTFFTAVYSILVVTSVLSLPTHIITFMTLTIFATCLYGLFVSYINTTETNAHRDGYLAVITKLAIADSTRCIKLLRRISEPPHFIPDKYFRRVKKRFSCLFISMKLEEPTCADDIVAIQCPYGMTLSSHDISPSRIKLLGPTFIVAMNGKFYVAFSLS